MSLDDGFLFRDIWNKHRVREAAVDVIRLVYQQGGLNPTIYISNLFAALADNSLFIRETALTIFESLSQKNSDLLLVNLSSSL